MSFNFKTKCLFFLLMSSSFWVHAKVVTKVIPYMVNNVKMTGYYAYDDSIKGQRPGILVVHEWWGHNDYARKRVRMLAELGYSAFALDMYGDGKLANHPNDAKKFMTETMSNMANARQRYLKGLDVLKSQSAVDANQLAAIGYCFGGGIVLDMARQGVDIKAVASFHGSLATKQVAKKGGIKARVLVLNGAADPFVPNEQIIAFKKEMEQSGANYQFINYPGAKHSFTNPGADEFARKFKMPLAYNKKADEQSWNKMKQLFKKVFK